MPTTNQSTYLHRPLKEYLFSGTVGDAFVALCKLDQIASSQPCALRRICTTSGSDSIISELAGMFNGIVYSKDYMHFDQIDQMRVYAYKNQNRYINIFFDGDGRGNEPDDPPEIIYNPFPRLKFHKPELDKSRTNIGIQLNSGSRAANRRSIDISWIADFVDLVAKSNMNIFILGTGDGYSHEELALLDTLPPHAHNIVGNAFSDWLGYLGSLDYLIAPEGVAAFFALSQKVPSLVMYSQNDAILRLAKEWRTNATCLRPIIKEDSVGKQRWAPMQAGQAASLILSRFNPDRC